jgi:hypothetical protein
MHLFEVPKPAEYSALMRKKLFIDSLCCELTEVRKVGCDVRERAGELRRRKKG